MTNLNQKAKPLLRLIELKTISALIPLLIALQPASAQLSGSAVNNLAASGGPDEQTPIRVVLPAAGTKIDAPKSFIVGCCHAGDAITCNGEPVHINKEGFFAHVISLKPGDNRFLLVESGSVSASREVHAVRTTEPPSLPPDKLALVKESLQPVNDVGVTAGDTIHFSIRATPGAAVTVTVNNKTIALRTVERTVSRTPAKKHKGATTKSGAVNATGGAGTKISMNSGMGVTYGKSFQRASNERSDQYFAFYKVTGDDDWKNIHPKFTEQWNGKSIAAVSNFGLTVLHAPLLAETKSDDTIVRVGPNSGRTTPLAKAVRLLVDGWQGDELRCIYGPNKHFWIAREALEWENDSNALENMERKFKGTAGPAPASVAKTINVVEDEFGNYISVPLTQRLPYQIVQSVKPNTLILKLYGVTADTDWVSDPRLSAAADDEPIKPSSRHNLVESVTWSQPSDGQYEVLITLKGHRQWGYKAKYEGNELRLHIRHPPAIDRSNSAQPLHGLKICLDPGHGGKESGAVGCSGIYEKSINLAISLRFQALLEKAGAQVIMTRTTDKDVSLDDRVRIANENKVDILISVHNNSLPDGRDPWKERGSSAYWYQPQSTELGRCLKNGLLASLGLPDLGNRFQNLALARPSAMPAVLSEVGFVINPDEYAMLISNEGQEAAAQGLYNGLREYLLGSEHKPAEHKASEHKPQG